MDDSSFKESFAVAIEYHKNNNLKKAWELYHQLIDKNPNNYLVLGNIGLLSIQLEKYDTAVNYLLKSIKLNSKYFQGYNNLGKVFFLLKNIKESINNFKIAIKLNNKSEDAHYNFSYILQKIGAHQEAKYHLNKVIEINPNNINALNNLGIILIALGKKKEAITVFKKIIVINPEFGNAYFNLYPLLIDQNKNKEAIKYLKKATECSPKKIYYQIFLIILLEYSGIKSDHVFQQNKLNEFNKALLDSWNYIKQKKTNKTKMISYTKDVLQLAKDNCMNKGLVLEFGVRFGTSIRQIAEIFKSKIHGFDSFEGLPEAWHNTPKNFYSTFGEIPSTPENVTLHEGLFSKSLPLFLQHHKDKIKFINIDCDIYSSTKTVLDLLSNQIVPGSIILFDEYIGNENWRKDEYKAFQEAVKKYNWNYEYLAFSVQTKQVLIKIT